MRLTPGVLLVACWLVIGRLPACAGEARGSLGEDRRLARPVTLSHGRVYLGELVEELSRESRVPLAAPDDNRRCRSDGTRRSD